MVKAQHRDELAHKIGMGIVVAGFIMAIIGCAAVCAGAFWLIGALYV